MIHIKPEHLQALDAGGKDAIKKALQIAIELEHSTIPVYLYSLYSLDENKNKSIAQIIQSVVVEEMLHMTLACNILNALGGSPKIDKPDFIPRYPGPLPGAVDKVVQPDGSEKSLQVGLAPFSKQHIHDVFMEIEEPEHPLDFGEVTPPEERDTIGVFYGKIKKNIREKLTDKDFANPPRNQLGPSQMDEAILVVDVKTACQAIDTIVEQGEGTSKKPYEVIGDDLAHYYRFAEIYYGCKLVNDESAPEGFSYSGEPVKFDDSGVFAAPSNPKTATYPPGSATQQSCVTFNYTYTTLLKALHSTFNGHPDKLNTAIGLMMSLKQQAKDMMSGLNIELPSAGPSFEFQPVNPADAS